MEVGISQDGNWRYNYSALRALLVTLTGSQISYLYDSFFSVAGTSLSKLEKISKLVTLVDQSQKVESLLRTLKKLNLYRYKQYIDEIKLPVYSSQTLFPPSPSFQSEFILLDQLKQKLKSILLRCEEFDSVTSLRAVMSIAPLYIYKDKIRIADTRRKMVSSFLADFQSERLADGRLVLPIFLRTLRDEYNQEEDIYTELTEILRYLPGGGESLPSQPSINIPEANATNTAQIYIAELKKLLKASDAVGKLVVPRYQGGVIGHREMGTAWLIAPGLALTCWHVIAARNSKFPETNFLSEVEIEQQIANSRLIFSFTAPGEGQAYEIDLIHANRDKDTFDYALLRLRKWDPRCGYLPINTCAPLGTSTDLYVIHHSQGQELQVTRGPCLGLSTNKPMRVLYNLDTAPGASGGPIFDAQNLAVVAIHWGKNCDTIAEGIMLKHILEDLSNQGLSHIYQEIFQAQQDKGGIL